MSNSGAPKERKRISSDEFQKDIEALCKGKICWKVGRYLGSMLYFDIGESVNVKSVRSGVIKKGEISLGIRNVFWDIHYKGSSIIDSSYIEREHEHLLTKAFLGQKFELFIFLNDFVEIHFSGGHIIYVDTSNEYETEGNILEISFHNRAIYEITCDAELYASTY